MLVFEFARIIREIKPKFFIMENVPGLANGIGKEIFCQVIRKIKSAGYSNYAYKVIDTADYGIPQRRKRLLFIGTNDPSIEISIPAPTNADPSGSRGLLKSWNTVKDAISDLPSIHAGEKNSKDRMHSSANLSDLNVKRIKATPKDGGSRNSWPDELVLECHKNINGYKDIYGRMRWNSPSPTITGGCCMISKGRFGHPEQNRAISLREAARLQTFPDDFVFAGNFGEIASQIGNAVPPLLTRRIGYLIQRLCKNSSLPDRNEIHNASSMAVSL
jgi:DNA (cytosine-5)-methyltransferase 1